MKQFLEAGFKGENQWYKYLAVILISFVAGQFIGAIPFVVIAFSGIQGEGDLQTTEDLLDLSEYGIGNTETLVILMIPFLVSFAFYVGLFKNFHKRSWISSINGRSRIRWGRFFSGIAYWGGISLLLFIVSYLVDPGGIEWQFDATKWLPLLVVSILIIPFQATYEELLFRGYLAQGVGRLTRSRWAVILLPAALFALLHGANPEIEKYGFWAMMPQYFTLGVTFGLISVLDDGIELAMGGHAINNIFSSVVVTYEGAALRTDALFLATDLNPQQELIGLVIFCAVLVYILSRKYRWQWSVLNARIAPTEPSEGIASGEEKS